LKISHDLNFICWVISIIATIELRLRRSVYRSYLCSAIIGVQISCFRHNYFSCANIFIHKDFCFQ